MPIIVEGPKAVPVETAMSSREWTSYRQLIWANRADAHAQRRYLARLKRWVTVFARSVQWGVALTSAAAFVQALTDAPSWLLIASTLVSAALAVTTQVFDLPALLQGYTSLVETLAGRALFWDQVWLITEGGKFAGSIADLSRPEMDIARQQAELSVPAIAEWKAQVMHEFETTDPLMSTAP